jgi:hypothetical protein
MVAKNLMEIPYLTKLSEVMDTRENGITKERLSFEERVAGGGDGREEEGRRLLLLLPQQLLRPSCTAPTGKGEGKRVRGPATALRRKGGRRREGRGRTDAEGEGGGGVRARRRRGQDEGEERGAAGGEAQGRRCRRRRGTPEGRGRRRTAADRWPRRRRPLWRGERVDGAHWAPHCEGDTPPCMWASRLPSVQATRCVPFFFLERPSPFTSRGNKRRSLLQQF